MEVGTGGSALGSCTGTSYFNNWGDIKRVSVAEICETVEMVYLEISNISHTVYPPRPPQRRVFKIIYSCKDGKWDKSERIYGNIVPEKEESYSFKDYEAGDNKIIIK